MERALLGGMGQKYSIAVPAATVLRDFTVEPSA
jgi:hypothetical protein